MRASGGFPTAGITPQKKTGLFFLHLPESFSGSFKFCTHAGYSQLPLPPRAGITVTASGRRGGGGGLRHFTFSQKVHILFHEKKADRRTEQHILSG